MIPEAEIYSTIGPEGFERFVGAFYSRVATDDLIGPMYPPEDLVGAEERLRNFLIFRFGGPPLYIEQRGHPKLRARHMPYFINRAARDRWMELMAASLSEAEIDPNAEATLLAFFESTTTFLINQT